MLPNVKQLRLSDLILNRRGSIVFRLILTAFGIALRLFFRRIETVNAGVVPENGGGIFVLNHPNGLIDPALVFVGLPKKISFLAKSTLFRLPVISFILKTVEALPLYRRIDAVEDVSKNQKTFEACRGLLKSGGSIALFPEGVSHNSPKLLPAKSGAARIALGAVSIGQNPLDLRIFPVGLFYTSKTTFRSEALLHFGEPFSVQPAHFDEDGQPNRAAVRALTERIENELREVTVNAESDSELGAARIAEEIFASVSQGEGDLSAKANFLKNYIEELRGGSALLKENLHEYDERLEKYGIETIHLSLAEYSRGSVARRALLMLWPLVVLFPIAAVGIALHFVAYQLCKLAARYLTHHGEDDIVSTVKVLASMVFMPLTWVLVAGVAGYLWGWQVTLMSFPLTILVGYVALYWLEQSAELRGWARAIWLFMTRRETFLRLYVERRDLLRDLQPAEQK